MRLVWIVGVMLVVSACGGGGSGASSNAADEESSCRDLFDCVTVDAWPGDHAGTEWVYLGNSCDFAISIGVCDEEYAGGPPACKSDLNVAPNGGSMGGLVVTTGNRHIWAADAGAGECLGECSPAEPFSACEP